MSQKERVHHRELFSPWLLKQISSNQYEGLYWLDEAHTLFRIPWKHLNRKSKDEQDYGIFRAWAIESGRYVEGCEDYTTWKTNFRCALNGVTYQGRTMFSEVEDNSKNEQDPHKIYRVNCVRPVRLTPAFASTRRTQTLVSAPCSAPVTPAHTSSDSSQSSTPPSEQSLQDLLDDEDLLRISPDKNWLSPFPVDKSEVDTLEELVHLLGLSHQTGAQAPVNNLPNVFYSQEYSVAGYDTYLDQSNWSIQDVMPLCKDSLPSAHQVSDSPYFHQEAQQQVYKIQQNGYAHVDSAFRHSDAQYQYNNKHCGNAPTGELAPPVTNGFETHCVHPQPSQRIPSHCQSAQQQVHSSQFGYPQDLPLVDRVFVTQSDGACQTANEICGNSCKRGTTPPHSNGFGTPASQPTQPSNQQSEPKLTSWNVTIMYKGDQVSQTTVNQKFVINTGSTNPDLDPLDIVCFPSTDMLVDSKQTELTNTILKSVGGGLLLEVSAEDYKLYATRMGKTKVYCALSEELETITSETQESKLIPREQPTAIFDFNRFAEELNAYKCHQRASPDYTIYLCFGQCLVRPIERRLVLVKLVPNFCTFFHDLAKREGATSINSDISLQISSSLTSMDIDFSSYI
ncbi:interferon regulatory factor 3-like isoform 2-T2 [Discoglossus pictus]